MDFTFDLATNQLIPTNGVDEITLKWRSREPVRIHFHRDGTDELLPSGYGLALYLKRSTTMLATCTSFTAPGTASGYYTGTLILNTDPLTTAFTTATVLSIAAKVEVHWWASGESASPSISDSVVSAQIVRPVVAPEPSSVETVTLGYEGTDIKSTGETGGVKYLREDGDGTCSWQSPSSSGDALVANNLDQFASVTQTAGQTLAITSSTTLAGGTHSGTNTGDQSLAAYAPLASPVFTGQIGTDGDIVGHSAGAVRYSDGQVKFSGGANSAPYHGGVGGSQLTYGADADGQHGGNGGSLLMYGTTGQNAGSVSTIAGGSLTMGTANIAGGNIAGTILTTAGSAASLTDFPTLNQNTTGSAATLTTARTINGTSFNGSANITVTAAGSTLSDTVPTTKGGTGLTAIGTALQVLRTNAGATALEFATLEDATKLSLTGGTLTGALTVPNSIHTGLSLTGSQATNTIDVSTTWNTTGAPALFYGRATNTASGATAKLMSLGTAAGGELFAISKLGAAEVKDNGTDAAPSFSFTGVGGAGAAGIRYSSGSLAVIVVAQGSPVCAIGYQLLRVGSTGIIGWSSSQFSPDAVSADLSLSRAAAASLQLGASSVSGWVSQTFAAAGGRIGTDTNNSPTNTLTIAGSISTGTGTGGNLRLGVYGTNGASGTAIGTLNTVLTVVAARKVINLAGIPTSASGLSSGDVYSNAGILTIVA